MQRRPRPCMFPCGCVKRKTAGSKVRAGRGGRWGRGKETGLCTGHLVGECSLARSMGPSISSREWAVLSDIPGIVNKLRLARRCFTHTNARDQLATWTQVHFKRVLNWNQTVLINWFQVPLPRCPRAEHNLSEVLFLVWDPSTWLITPSQCWEILHPPLVFISKSFNFRASLVRLMENWAALSCSKEQCSHSLAWHSSISPNAHRYRLLINASELFWDWKF